MILTLLQGQIDWQILRAQKWGRDQWRAFSAFSEAAILSGLQT
jgi:hypothetical protein